jgi:hypothetical protein
MFNFTELKKRNLLSIESMSTIRGGSVGTCGFWSSSGEIACNVSMDDALAAVAGGGYWCCDSCASSSYCGGGDMNPAVCRPE